MAALVHRRPRPPAWAPAAPSSSACCAGGCDKDGILRSLLEATRTTAAVFTVLIGALLFGYFLTITQTPQKVTEFLTGLGLGSYGVLALIMLMYLRARLPDGCAGDDHPDRADHLSGHQRSSASTRSGSA